VVGALIEAGLLPEPGVSSRLYAATVESVVGVVLSVEPSAVGVMTLL
jgi:hypothetical protein